MKSTLRFAAFALPVLLATTSFAASGPLSLKVDAVGSKAPIMPDNAVCIATPDGKSVPTGKNMRPTVSWTGTPKGTESFAIVMVDPDVPADFGPANKDGIEIAAEAPRQNFYHWGLADIPGNVARIPGSSAIGVGEPATNDMKGYVKDTQNYGGPCPPWNDARLHHYHFILYALDVKSLGLTTGIKASELHKKLDGNPHVIAKSEVVGTYTLNPAVRAH